MELHILDDRELHILDNRHGDKKTLTRNAYFLKQPLTHNISESQTIYFMG